MLKSRYNFIRRVGEQYVLYNARTEAIAVLDSEVAKLYEKNSVEQIKAVHPDFFEYLCNQEFVVEDSFDELKAQLQKWSDNDTDERYFSVSVNPTLNCNLSCWYCYENHKGDLNITPEVIHRIKLLIASKMSNDKLEQFSLDFFGGEPLLNFNAVGKKLIDYTLHEAKKNGKRVSFSFVTNGVLLTKDILDFLDETGCLVSFQITLDGNEDLHNSIRHTRAGANTYSTILRNASHILEYKNMNLVLRCNFTSESLPTFVDVASDISEWHNNPMLDLSRLTIDLHQVWQDHAHTSTIDVANIESNVRDAFMLANIPIAMDKRANRYRCYAERSNSLLVNHNGELFRCTARDFTTANSEGFLNDDGVPEWNEKSQRRDAIKWNNPTCHDCNIYPLCCGACSQNKLDSGNLSGCDYGYSSSDKEEIITERIKWLISQAHN